MISATARHIEFVPTSFTQLASSETGELASQSTTSAASSVQLSNEDQRRLAHNQRQIIKIIADRSSQGYRNLNKTPTDHFDHEYVESTMEAINQLGDRLDEVSAGYSSATRPTPTAMGKMKNGARLTGGAITAVGAAVAAGAVGATIATGTAVVGVFVGAGLGAVGGYGMASDALRGAPKPLRVVASVTAALVGATVLGATGPIALPVYANAMKGSFARSTFHALNRLPQIVDRVAYKKMSIDELVAKTNENLNASLIKLHEKGDEFAGQHDDVRSQRTIYVAPRQYL